MPKKGSGRLFAHAGVNLVGHFYIEVVRFEKIGII